LQQKATDLDKLGESFQACVFYVFSVFWAPAIWEKTAEDFAESRMTVLDERFLDI
jgi:hypothetical protein